MGVDLVGLKVIDPSDCDDDRRLTYKMSAGRYVWLSDYAESVAPGVLHRYRVIRTEDDGDDGLVHEKSCLEVAAVLTAELSTDRPQAYCEQLEYPGRNPAPPLDVDDIRTWRDFLLVCGGYRSY